MSYFSQKDKKIMLKKVNIVAGSCHLAIVRRDVSKHSKTACMRVLHWKEVTLFNVGHLKSLRIAWTGLISICFRRCTSFSWAVLASALKVRLAQSNEHHTRGRPFSGTLMPSFLCEKRLWQHGHVSMFPYYTLMWSCTPIKSLKRWTLCSLNIEWAHASQTCQTETS